jgi:hypothetical protein
MTVNELQNLLKGLNPETEIRFASISGKLEFTLEDYLFDDESGRNLLYLMEDEKIEFSVNPEFCI